MISTARNFSIDSLDELKEVAKVLLSERSGQDVWRLAGDLGAGKTQFCKTTLELLNFSGVTSPTYSLHNVYETPFGNVDHLDLYRIEKQSELGPLGFFDLFQKPQGLILIEWADRAPQEMIPKAWSVLNLKFKVNGARTLSIG